MGNSEMSHGDPEQPGTNGRDPTDATGDGQGRPPVVGGGCARVAEDASHGHSQPGYRLPRPAGAHQAVPAHETAHHPRAGTGWIREDHAPRTSLPHAGRAGRCDRVADARRAGRSVRIGDLSGPRRPPGRDRRVSSPCARRMAAQARRTPGSTSCCGRSGSAGASVSSYSTRWSA